MLGPLWLAAVSCGSLKFPCHPPSPEVMGQKALGSLQYSSGGIWMLVDQLALAWLDMPKTVPHITNGNVTMFPGVSPSRQMTSALPCLGQIQSDPHFPGSAFVWNLGGARCAEGPQQLLCAEWGPALPMPSGWHPPPPHCRHPCSFSGTCHRPVKPRTDRLMLLTWLDSRKPELICQAKLMRKERPK